MKRIKKSNVKTNALIIPSQAADALNIDMCAFIRKDINTLKESVVCAVQFRNENSEVTQTEDIVINESDLGGFEKYDTRLKQRVPINVMIDNEETKSTTTCIKDLKKFLRSDLNKLPIRMYYDKGYGWTKDEVTSKVRFDGASIAGMNEMILDDHEHHLLREGEQFKTIEICNEVMRGRVSTQFLLATSLAAPIFGALDLKSLIVNICGLSSQGKSTILKLCISLWSRPDDEHLSTTWYNTENAICARLNNLEGVPFLLDDTSQGNTKNFTNVVYNIEDGKSKGRLNKLFLVDNVATWHTCIFSGSENSMYDKTDEDKKGILRRLIELDVAQGDLLKDEIQAQKVDKISNENYGHVGIGFVNKLFEMGLTDNNFERLITHLEKEQAELQNNVHSNGVSKGLAKKLAVVLLAAKLGIEHLGLEFDIDELTEYVQTLIAKTELKIKQVIIDKKDFDTCYKEVCEFAEEKLDDRYKEETKYNIPVEYFNIIERQLGYNFKELRVLFMRHGICTFSNTDGDKGLDNTVRIMSLEDGVTKPKKVITVTKMK
ncbi:hypothetical protein LAD12857_10340 [Lacrimispora amygdalina]|uniref:DUF927 domain-containing protein n=1 Tax=Lacrimispora amygdalina TaxID=253257 RepID=A0ABQ5M2C9_9FIRM